MQKRKKALQGLKVVDFSWVFTGPIVTKYLGDHGAEIIKIESAARPDGTRLMTPFAPGAMGLNSSGVFANYNSSKYSININLREPRGKQIVHRLVERADSLLSVRSSRRQTASSSSWDGPIDRRVCRSLPIPTSSHPGMYL